jgi:hypothetical protein
MAADGTPDLSQAALHGDTSPAVRWLDALLYDALQDGASDIHLENGTQGALLRLRYRVGERCFDVDLPAGASGGGLVVERWTGAERAAIEQPLTMGVGRHADTWRSVGHWEQAARARTRDVRLVPYRTWVRAADIAGSDGVGEVRRRVRELTSHLDPLLPGGRGGWPAAARDAAREAYLIARWCAVGAS